MFSFAKGCLVYLLVLAWISVVLSACPNGCSNRGLCINNACVCAEGLSGNDCSIQVKSGLPTLYECPTCYQVTVGPARYYTGPSWRIPDGPIVALNYKGSLSVYQGNGNGELVARGFELDDFVPTPVEALLGGTAGNFDSCGSWIMRAITLDSGNIAGFYHAETACDYNNNGQTRKSGGYAVSQDGGNTFTKPNYPYNKVVDTGSPILTGLPSGEGDYSVVLKDNYYYMFFANVETYHTGVARATRSSDGYPGAFYKFNNNNWNQPAVGGNSSRLENITGPQAYLHTPSKSFVAAGNYNPLYWNQGFMMSVSDDALNWAYFADPIITPDPMTNNDQFMYPSFMGTTGGYDIGNKFEFFYMWIAPGSTWTYRYQIMKDITLTYVGADSNVPRTKIALTSFSNTNTGETWQTTEMALAPYKTTNIVGYLMSRPYENTFVVYDCLNYTTNDHFVGTAAECFLSGAGVEAIRTLGHIWFSRFEDSVAVYRCYGPNNDLFLSSDSNCENRGSPQTVPFGYMMNGPAITNAQKSMDVLIPQGSTWKFYNKSSLADSWTNTNFDDSAWSSSLAPFGNMYSTDLLKSYFGPRDYYFRTTFQIPAGSSVKKMLLSVASDNYALVYVNGVLVDKDNQTWHEAAYWNRRVYIPTTVLTTGTNSISVIVKNQDAWAFFDLELSVRWADVVVSPIQSSCPATCGINGQCISGKCTCDIGFSGSDCSTELCPLNASPEGRVIFASGSSFRHSQWSYVASTPVGWFSPSFDDSWWQLDTAPFGTTYYSNRVTTIGGARHLYRKKFLIEVPFGKEIKSATISLATDDTHRVYVNGVFVGAEIFPYNGHFQKKWNDVIEISGNLLKDGTNVIAIEVPLADGRWTAYFDMQFAVTFAIKSCSAPSTPTSPPTSAPTVKPTNAPTSAPTTAPTVAPTVKPTNAPTSAPTVAPTVKPTNAPTSAPTVAPTVKPTNAPTSAPTVAPTVKPTNAPTSAPTVKPTNAPTSAPTSAPTTRPPTAPTTRPTTAPLNSLKLNLNSGVSSWWFAITLSGGRSTEVTKIEIKDSGSLSSFKDMTNQWGDVWVAQPLSALVLPITVRASLPSGASISFSVSSFSTLLIDSGLQF